MFDILNKFRVYRQALSSKVCAKTLGIHIFTLVVLHGNDADTVLSGHSGSLWSKFWLPQCGGYS